MLFIDISDPEVLRAHSEHVRNISCRIFKKVTGGNCSDPLCKICKRTEKNMTIPDEIRQVLSDKKRIEQIVGNRPQELMNINTEVWNLLMPLFTREQCINAKAVKPELRTKDEEVRVATYDLICDHIKGLVDYGSWFQNGKNDPRYDAYQLARNLNRNTCTYCNRIYTGTMTTVDYKKVMRPSFDHWYGQVKYPLLALSFYNLIPSCSICNSSIKGDAEFDLDSHLHPYINVDVLDRFRYSYDFNETTDKFRIKIRTRDGDHKMMTTIAELKLNEVFDTHHEELADLIKIREAYSESYISDLIKRYPGANLSYKEVYRLAFGVEFDQANYHRLPLSKFKMDVLSELQMMRELK